MPQTASEWMTLLVGVSTLIAAVGLLIGWFKKWVRQQVAEPLIETNHQLSTSNGKTVANYVEGMSVSMEGLHDMVQQNHDTAVKGLTLAELAHTRLDQHIHERKD